MLFRDYIGITNLANAIFTSYAACSNHAISNQDAQKIAIWLLNYCHILKRQKIDDYDQIDEDTQEQLLEVPVMQVERLVNAWLNFQELVSLDKGKSHVQNSKAGYQLVSTNNPNFIANNENTSWNDYDVISKQNDLLDKSNQILEEIYEEWKTWCWNN